MRLDAAPSIRDRLRVDQRLIGPGIAPQRFFRSGFPVSGDGVHFPAVGLVWPAVMPTPTWRVVVRSIIAVSDTAGNYVSAFWTKGPVGNWTPAANGGALTEDKGAFNGIGDAACYVASNVAHLTGTSEGDHIFDNENMVTGAPPTAINLFEWMGAATIPLLMRNSPTSAVILAVSGFLQSGIIRVFFEWEEIP